MIRPQAEVPTREDALVPLGPGGQVRIIFSTFQTPGD